MTTDTSAQTPSAADTAVIDHLRALQEELGSVRGQPISDAAFARHYLPFSETSWSRLKAGKYGADADRLLAKAAVAAAEIPARIEALRRAAGAGETFVQTSLARAAIAAVRAARDSGTRRIVPVVAPTGYGKTTLARYFASRGAIIVTGRQSWQYSYKAFCADVCAACGAPLPKSAREADTELEMIRRLRVKGAGLLVIDEGNTMSAAIANGLKTIHNSTDFSVVVAAVPGPWESFVSRAEEEVRQVINRCQPIIRVSHLLESDVLPLLMRSGYPEIVLRTILPAVTDLANAFGGLSTLVQIIDDMRSSDAQTLDAAKTSIANIRRAIIASGLAI